MNTLPLIRNGSSLQFVKLRPFKDLKKPQYRRHRTLDSGFRRVALSNPGSMTTGERELLGFLKAAWERLGAATISEQTLCDLLLILTHTCAAKEYRDISPAQLNRHPIDIRGLLSDRQATADLLVSLSGFWDRSVARLNRFDKLPHPSEQTIDLFLWARCGICIDHNEIQFNERFRTELLPFIHGKASLEDLLQLKEWYEYAGLVGEPANLSPVLIHIVRELPLPSAWRWCQLLLEDADRFTYYRASRIRYHKMADVPVDDRLFEVFSEIRMLSSWDQPDHHINAGWEAILSGLKTRIPFSILKLGIHTWRLTDHLPRFAHFKGIFPSDHFAHCRRTIGARYYRNGFVSKDFVGKLFELFGKFPHAAKYAAAIPHQSLPGLRYRSVLNFLVNEVDWSKSNAFDFEKLAALCDFCRESENRSPDADLLNLASKILDSSVRQQFEPFQSALQIAKRHDSLGLRMSYEMDCFWRYRILNCVRFQSFDRIEAFPDSVFKQIAKTFRNENQAERINAGSWEFGYRRRIDTLRMLPYFPGKYASTMLKLGDLGPEMASALNSYIQHPLCESDVWEWPLEKAYLIVDAVLSGSRLKDPFPKRLREHLAGVRTLEKKIVERDRLELGKGIIYMRLEILEREIDRVIGSQIDPDHVSVHSLTLSKQVEKNRRALRRYVRIAASGAGSTRTLIVRHPNNEMWLRSLDSRGIDPSRWVEGLKVDLETKDHGIVSIGTEHEPDEMLKMGTYVNSCLGIGGCYSYSAVANMYDINKQIIYARNGKGKVIARQLVALSREKHLVCFDLYPYQISEELRKKFFEFDREFSEKVGVPLFDEKEHREYQIENLVCRDWYDDEAITVPRL